jgi:hypothetical protein
VELKKDGHLVNTSQEDGTIFVGLDRISIPSMEKRSYAGNYRISARNKAGEGYIDFQLKVVCKFAMHAPDNFRR